MTISASIVGPTFVTVMVNGQTHTINSDHTNYSNIREALKVKDFDLVEKLINVAKAVTNFVAGRVSVVGDKVMYGDHEIKGSVVQRIIAMIKEGFDPGPMIKFLENLMANPSKRAVDELYGFLEATALPITEDGCFLAYKKVRDDYLDYYTGKVSNKLASLMTAEELASFPKTVGAVTVEVIDGVTTVHMQRNQVDDEKDRTCSYGLHFCSLSYLPHYYASQGRVVIVKINPADVVSIPSDYNNAKGRACRYEVIGEHTSENTEAWDRTVVNSQGGDYDPCDDGKCDDDTNSTDDDEWDRGWDAGADAANEDSLNQVRYNDKPQYQTTARFADGYSVGYAETYCVDWNEVGHNQGYRAAHDGKSYDDTAPAACDDHNEYREGYADGWHTSKLEQLG